MPRLGLTLVLLLVGACSHEFTYKDYKKACKGQPVAEAAPYVKGGISPIIGFEKRFKEFRKPAAPVPDEWTSPKDPKKYQLVACVEAVKSNAFEVCRYDGGSTLQLYDATYQMSIVEARTGKVLGSSTVELANPQRECLLVRSFDQKSEGDFPDFRPDLKKLAEPFVVAP